MPQKGFRKVAPPPLISHCQGKQITMRAILQINSMDFLPREVYVVLESDDVTAIAPQVIEQRKNACFRVIYTLFEKSRSSSECLFDGHILEKEYLESSHHANTFEDTIGFTHFLWLSFPFLPFPFLRWFTFARL